MLISEQQQAANRRNAQRSTGPKTPQGKAAVRFNALTWSLRARRLIIPHREDPAEYQQLADALNAEFQPQTEAERHYLEQMVIAQWLLVRAADSEYRVYEANLRLEKQIALLDRVDARRARLERSFTAGLHELQRLQKERQARAQQPSPQPVQATQAPVTPLAEPPVPPAYMMSECAENHPRSCSTPDTR